jgi:hypothetical protein
MIHGWRSVGRHRLLSIRPNFRRDEAGSAKRTSNARQRAPSLWAEVAVTRGEGLRKVQSRENEHAVQGSFDAHDAVAAAVCFVLEAVKAVAVAVPVGQLEASAGRNTINREGSRPVITCVQLRAVRVETHNG